MAWESEADARDHARREAQARHSPSPGEPAGTCWPRRRGHRRGRRGLLLERPEGGDRRIEAAFFSGFYPEGVTRVEPIRTCVHTHARMHTCARTGGEDMRGLSSRGTCALGRADADGDPAHVCWTQSGAGSACGKPARSASRGGFAGGRRGRSRDRALRAPSLRERVGCGAAAGFGSEAWTRHSRRPLARGARLAPPLRLSLRPPCVSHQPPETPPYITAPATAGLPRACAGVCSRLTHVRICLNLSLCAQMSPCQNSLHPVY